MSPHRISIASPPDREKLVAEIFFEDLQWAELNEEYGFFEVEFCERPDGIPWKIPLVEAVAALEDSQRKLEARQ